MPRTTSRTRDGSSSRATTTSLPTDREQWSELQRFYGSAAISDAELEWLRSLIVDSGMRAEAMRLARHLAADAGDRVSRLGSNGRPDGLASFLTGLLQRAA